MKYTEYVEAINAEKRKHPNVSYAPGFFSYKYVIGGSYFTYKGVQYGEGTRIWFTSELWHKVKKKTGCGMPFPLTFHSIYQNSDGKDVWVCGFLAGTGIDVVPDRDIEKIVTPKLYVEPPTNKELIHQRLHDGTWFDYTWDILLCYILAVIVSPIFTQWYVLVFNGLLLAIWIACDRLVSSKRDL